MWNRKLADRKLLSSLVMVAGLAASGADRLESAFVNPPESARPQTWWHWMNGNVTREGITADLEAMKQIGLGAATIFNVDCSIPAGPVKFMSPEWREHFKFAVQEAERLDFKLGIMNCAGWSSSGGPWNTVTNAMQRLTSSEARIAGPHRFDAVLPLPPANLGYYHDIGVLAFKAPPVAAQSTGARAAKLEITRAVYEPDFGGVADVTSRLNEMVRDGRKSVGVNNIDLGGDPAPGAVKQLRVELSLDGQAASVTVGEGDTLVFPADTNELAAIRSIGKTSAYRTFVRPPPATVSFGNTAIPRDGILNLTTNMDADGRLRWDVPSGDWIVLRLGYTPIGVNNHPAPREGLGLECDKLTKTGLDAHWEGFMKKILDEIGSLAGKTLVSALVDSYEVGTQDWSPKFREEFQKRRGYDPLPFLPAFNRFVVESPAVTERFLWDMRKTVSDLFAENYFAHFADLCRQNGLISEIEPYTGPFESLISGAPADVVMGEFWTGSQGDPSVKMTASLAHIYGKSIVAAESFTGWPNDGRWQNDPYSLKPLGDLMFCQGINRFVFHRYAMQPWTNRWPGMTMGPFGINFERTATWWNQGKAWIDYLSRCQFLLQQGRTVADAAYFVGESAPVVMRAGNPPLPAGYDYDAVNADVLLRGAAVLNGRLVLASGANYAVLILPPDDANMTPRMVRRLRDLIRAGLTVVGPRPQHSPSLDDYPRCDAQVKQIADEIWGPCDGKTVLENPLGKGRVVWGKSLEEILVSCKLKPDFEVSGGSAGTNLAYTHRVDGTAHIYFVSNQRRESSSADCTFRVNGKVPELWHPDTGRIETAAVWSENDGRTHVKLDFDPAGSVFVVFRQLATGADHLVEALPARWEPGVSAEGSLAVKAWKNGHVSMKTANGKVLHAEATNVPAPFEISGSWTLTFPPGWGAPPMITWDKLGSWTGRSEPGVRYFSGTATYENGFELSAAQRAGRRELWLNLGSVKNFAEVIVNGKELGVLWKPPFRVNITRAAKAGTNRIVLKVTNLWPNRIIGDEQLPGDAEWKGEELTAVPQWVVDGKPSPTGRLTFSTWRHYTKESPLLESGLLGPVAVETAEIIRVY